jgi:hypothetical protein
MTKKKLGLKRDNIKPEPQKPMTQEEAAAAMGNFYAVMGDCVLNMVPILERIAMNLEQVVIEISDIKDNLNRKGLHEGWITELDIAEREREDDGQPD